MSKQWIVVADAAAARFFTRRGDGHLERAGAEYHDDSRKHEGELRTGGKGDVHDSAGSGQHQPDPQTSTGEKQADIFAKEIAEKLKQADNDRAFDELVLVAAPSFLGLLREQLDDTVAARVKSSIDKDWTQEDDQQIAKHLDNQL